LFARAIIFGLGNIRWQGKKLGNERFQRLALTLEWILPVLGLRYALIYALDLGSKANIAIDILLRIFFVVLILLLCDTFLQLLLRWLEIKNPTKLTETVQLFYLQIIRIFLIILGIIMILSLLGLNVSGIVTGLGIGGLAVSLAAKDTLTNLFAGIAIMSDKMFELGDLIQGPDFEGTVEFIGLRSSRVRSYDQTEYIVPNSKLTDNVVVNLSHMLKRRLRLSITLPSYVSREQVDKLKHELRQFIESRKGATADKPYIALESLANNNLTLMLQYYLIALDFRSFVTERDELLSFVWDMLERENLRVPRSQVHLLHNENVFTNND